jgi:NAD/NADP transhydrogenase beta subunit
MEGLVAAFMFVLGGSGFIILDQTHATNMPKLNRMMLQFIGFGSMIMAFSACWIFMKIKLPGYMQS